MTTVSSDQPSIHVQELEPFDKRSLDVGAVAQDLTEGDLKKLLAPNRSAVVFPFLPIETLNCTKTVGHGRTNLTLIAPTIVQIDSATPSASFDVRSQTRHPAVQMHFEPAAYGITSVGTYIMEFTIQVFGQSTFNLAGFAGAGTVLNAGTKVLNGTAKVSLILQNVPPTQQTFGFLEETAGGAWTWLSVQVRFPPIVAQP
jgi:hypothetical protein